MTGFGWAAACCSASIYKNTTQQYSRTRIALSYPALTLTPSLEFLKFLSLLCSSRSLYHYSLTIYLEEIHVSRRIFCTPGAMSQLIFACYSKTTCGLFVCLKSTVQYIASEQALLGISNYRWWVVDEDMNVVGEVMEVTDSDTLMVISSLNPVGGTTMC